MFDFKAALKDLEKEDSCRKIKAYEKEINQYRHLEKCFVNFSSNDYFQLSENKTLIEKAISFTEKYGAGSCASQLITGHLKPMSLARERVKTYKNAPDSLIFSSGFMANIGVMRSLSEAGAYFYFDQYAHASLIDGILATKSKWRRFRHNDVEHLMELLKKDETTFPVIVTEAVFSMQGDRALLKDLHSLAKTYGGLLYVDEAHAVGVFDASLSQLDPGFVFDDFQHLVFMGTFGKALGGFGAYVCGEVDLLAWVVNRARTLIYSTALPPSVLGAMVASLEWLEDNPDAGNTLLEKSKKWRDSLQAPMALSDSQIIPILTGTNEKTMSLERHLKKQGLLGIGIRPPTVPPGSGLVRLAMNLGHTEEDLEKCKRAIEGFF